MRWTVFDTLVLHALIGVGFGVAYVIRCQAKQKRRRWFRFGGGHDPFTLGRKQAWLRWYFAAYVFEFVTSFLMSGRDIYVELAQSVFEALALTIGLFLVDRITLFLEVMPDTEPPEETSEPPGEHVDLGARIRAARERWQRRSADAATKRTTAEQAAHAERRQRFNASVRGK